MLGAAAATVVGRAGEHGPAVDDGVGLARGQRGKLASTGWRPTMASRGWREVTAMTGGREEGEERG
uniref:DUF834 domain-containing protein n=1 Tax=Oryza glumipatula TaxID=40148 RepID=A0A0D9YZR6_9ORYZ